MKSYKEFSFLPTYTKTRNNLYKDFYEPCMKNAIRYDRITGYFGSSVFIVICEALKDFINNNGRIRIICSPNLTEEDMIAIIEGYSTKEVEERLISSINKILDELIIKYPKSTLLLSKLIASGFLEIRFAVFGDNPEALRLMHDKAGLFFDNYGNAIAFRGSINETFKGLSSYGNSESFDVYTNWGENNDKYRLSLVNDQFDKMWNGNEPKITTFKIFEVTLEKIKSLTSSQNISELIDEVTIELDVTENKPINNIKIEVDYDELVVGETIKLNYSVFPPVSEITLSWDINNTNITTIDKNGYLIAKSHGEIIVKAMLQDFPEISTSKAFNIVKWGAEPGKNRRRVRPYQQEILNNWEKNNRRGLFQMATGSGKTFTALCAIRDAIYIKNEIPVIIVPRDLLFEHWEEEIEKTFGRDVFLIRCGSGHGITTDLRLMTKPLRRKICIISTIQTASKKDFLDNITQGSHLFLVVDEVHNAGSKEYSKILNLNVGPRIGLSATPTRYGDEIGTGKIFKYFGDIVKPIYTLEDAIKDQTLCEYFYYPKVVNLTDEEQEQYRDLTQEISKRFAVLKNKKFTNREILEEKKMKNLLIKRADIIKKAYGKTNMTYEILQSNYKRGDRWLIYCDDTEQLNIVKRKVKEIKSIAATEIYEYHSKYKQKSEVMEYFENAGGVMFSINCLDEGVDVPAIDHLIILASSKNERQFIQRRGRALRKANNKHFAYIYDAIVSPNVSTRCDDKIPFLASELRRAMIFANSAKNRTVALSEIKIIEIENMNYELGEIEDEQ